MDVNKYMTVLNIYIKIINDNIEESVIIKDPENTNDSNHLVCSACLCLISTQPIFQLQ